MIFQKSGLSTLQAVDVGVSAMHTRWLRWRRNREVGELCAGRVGGELGAGAGSRRQNRICPMAIRQPITDFGFLLWDLLIFNVA